MSATIIGLIGPKKSGKTSALNILKQNKANVIELQLAKKLKDVCSEVFNIERTNFDDVVLKETKLDSPIYLTNEHLDLIYKSYNIQSSNLSQDIIVLNSPRNILQYVGTEILRSQDEYIHCKQLNFDMNSNNVYVVSDIRFLNEFKYFMQYNNFYPVYIQRDSANIVLDEHSSEQSVLEIKEHAYILENNGTLEELENSIKNYLTLLD